MKIEYFPETDTLYIDLSERPSTDSREIGEGIVLDLDEKGLPVGLDIDQASKHLDLKHLDLKRIPFEVHQSSA